MKAKSKAPTDTGKAKPKKKRSLPSSADALPDLPSDVLAKVEHRINISTSVEEREYLTEYVKMFKRLRRLIKHSYDSCMESSNGRGYYQLCTLISQQREVIADIRTMADFSVQVAMLDQQVLSPLERRIAQAVIDSYYHTRRLLQDVSSPKKLQFALRKHEALARDLTTIIQSECKEAQVAMSEALLGPAQKPKKERKGA